ncbi:SDR family oxidoreductase [Caballeronia sp. J97]|uniref:SDR family NAD(P)-dependent oxidoreductase n=1 Tax=Caballeronia sp. J97 TaxID=2805429 RepID=UPI002AB12E2C|nr:SDR family oxidoreductase [Caballeronia sp. J97]
MKRFEGSVVAITGAAGGLGSQIAEAFRAEGARVSCTDIRKPDSVDPADLWTVGNIVQTSDANAFVESTRERFGALHVLVNCAGAVGRSMVHAIEDDDWDRVVGVNLTATFKCTRAALKIMRSQEGGVIVNVASQAGVRVQPNMAHYSASKAAVLQFTKSVALEYAPKIRCNSVTPGLIETPLVRQAWIEFANQVGITFEEARAQRLSVIPLQRFQTAQNVSDGILFLASKEACTITGTNLDVSAGELIPR